MMEPKEWYWKTKLKTVQRALIRNGMKAYVVADAGAALRKALSLIPRGASVGLGGSRTVAEIGLLDALRAGDYRLYDQYASGLGRAASMDLRKKGTHAEFFVSGSNAITEDGKIVNVDGLGNRLAALCFGPKTVIIAAGRNKIVDDVEAGLDRVKNVAAPMNAKRFGLDTPCVRTGRCSDCDSKERICNLTLIIERQKAKGRMVVILINQDLGF
jgi:L-lactate utilization protein LutB